MLIFGYEIPVTEVFLILVFLMIIGMILLIIAIKRLRDINKKLDAVLAEEMDEIDTLRSFKSELDETLDDERKQIKVIKELATKIDEQKAAGKKEIDILKSIRTELDEILKIEKQKR